MRASKGNTTTTTTSSGESACSSGIETAPPPATIATAPSACYWDDVFGVRLVEHIARVPMIRILQPSLSCCHVYAYRDFFVQMFANRYVRGDVCLRDAADATCRRPTEMPVDDFLVMFSLYKTAYRVPLDLLPYLTKECEPILKAAEREMEKELDLCDCETLVLLHFVKHLRSLSRRAPSELRAARVLEHRDRFRAFYFSPRYTSYYERHLARGIIAACHKDKLLADYIDASKRLGLDAADPEVSVEERALRVAQLCMLLCALEEIQSDRLSTGDVLSLHYILDTLSITTPLHTWLQFMDHMYKNNIPLAYIGLNNCFERVYSICRRVLAPD